VIFLPYVSCCFVAGEIKDDVILSSAAGQDDARQGRVGAQRPRRHGEEAVAEQQAAAEPERSANQETRWSGSPACQSTRRLFFYVQLFGSFYWALDARNIRVLQFIYIYIY